MKYPKLRELKEAIKSLISSPYTGKFPLGPARPVPKGLRGKPVYNKDVCVGCGACAKVCPVGVIQVTDNAVSKKRSLTQILDLCVYCGQCERYCITKTGIQLTQEYDLATCDRNAYRGGIEKELALCEMCNSVIGPVDHIKWVAERVEESAFTNPTLMLTLLQSTTTLKKEQPPKPSSFVRRPDRIRILCHKCRRVTTIE
jgi:hydrogenase-4 component H